MQSAAGSTLVGILLGFLFIAFGIPLAVRKVRPNRLYGFRSAKTLGNAEIWYKANAYTGKAFIVCGAAVALLAAGFPIAARHFGIAGSSMADVALAVDLVPVLVAAALSYVYAARL
jgi:hypothetical protein